MLLSHSGGSALFFQGCVQLVGSLRGRCRALSSRALFSAASNPAARHGRRAVCGGRPGAGNRLHLCVHFLPLDCGAACCMLASPAAGLLPQPVCLHSQRCLAATLLFEQIQPVQAQRELDNWGKGRCSSGRPQLLLFVMNCPARFTCTSQQAVAAFAARVTLCTFDAGLQRSWYLASTRCGGCLRRTKSRATTSELLVVIDGITENCAQSCAADGNCPLQNVSVLATHSAVSPCNVSPAGPSRGCPAVTAQPALQVERVPA